MTRATAAILVGLFIFPAGALAQGGVFIDPDTPAGKEYAIPLDEARRNATGGDQAVGPAGETPLFGAGIQAGSEGSAQAREDGGNGDRASGGSNGGDRAMGGSAGAQRSAAVSAAVGDSNFGLTAGIIGAVLAGAALAGFALRRGLRES